MLVAAENPNNVTPTRALYEDCMARVVSIDIGGRSVKVRDAKGKERKYQLTGGLYCLAKFGFHGADYYVRREISSSGQVYFAAYRLCGDYLVCFDVESSMLNPQYVIVASEMQWGKNHYVDLSDPAYANK